MDLLPKLMMTGLGTGYLRPAPGTWGSLGPCAVFLLASLSPLPCGPQLAMLAILAVACAGCVKYGPWAEKHFGKKDPSYVTIDEWAGQSLTLIALPVIAGESIYVSVAVAFVCFRIFDIVKPPPARRAERLASGWGILADDLVAGVYANVTSQFLLRWLLPAVVLPRMGIHL